MNPEIKAVWVDALRSPNRTQGAGRLRDAQGRECCLGVLCDLAADAGVIRWGDEDGLPIAVPTADPDEWTSYTLPAAVAAWAGLDADSPDSIDPEVADPRPNGRQPVKLSTLNDTGWSFVQIADAIERGL